jgi:hypothetical protein
MFEQRVLLQKYCCRKDGMRSPQCMHLTGQGIGSAHYKAMVSETLWHVAKVLPWTTRR